MPSSGWIGPWIALACDDRLAGLIGEQIDRMRGVVPQQMVGPAARLALGVHVRAAEEIGLHVHLLDVEFAGRRSCLCTHWWLGLKRRVWPTMQTRPVSFCCASTASASAQLSASGISTCTCLPAFMQAIACVGVHLRRRAQDHRVDVLAAPGFGQIGRGVARCRICRRLPAVLSSSRLTSETISTPSISLEAVEMLFAEGAGAGECDLIVLLMSFSRTMMADRRVRCGDVVRSDAELRLGDLPSPSAPRMISHITSSMPSLPVSRRYSICGIAAQPLRVGDQLVEEVVVPLAVDQAGARALQLVAHAAGAPDLHVQILPKALHRRADRLAQHPAAVARGHRIGDDVDRERNDLARPFLRLAEHQRQRHGQAVIDVHLVDDGHVEIVEDQALRDVPGEIGMA